LIGGEQERERVAPRGTYRQIAEDLRQRIARGEFGPGALVPSELTLAEAHEVSRGTVRAALALLVDEGLVEVVPGQGRRVVGTPVNVEPASAYERIAAELSARVAAGEFGTNDPLPSEAALVEAHGVSRNTVRRAYKQLVDAGVVVIKQGAGAYPAPR
jgi:DNA-binding GntR family transcriptional regulator